MHLDARSLRNPIGEQKEKRIRHAVTEELRLLQRKIVMATEVGSERCVFLVKPTLQYPDPEVIASRMIQQLQASNFGVQEQRTENGVLLSLSWGTPSKKKTHIPTR